MTGDIRTRNRKMIEEYLKENENPILNSFKHLIKTTGKKGKLPKEYYINMLPS